MGIISKVTAVKRKSDQLEELKKVCAVYDGNSSSLKHQAEILYEKRKYALQTINQIETAKNNISNLPNWFNEDFSSSLVRLVDFRKAVEYEKYPEKFAELTDLTGGTIDLLEKDGTINKIDTTTAISIATILGSVSTGSTISSISSAAATNAALVWLGSGSTAAGGALIGGSLALGMFGPIGLAVSGIATATSISLLRSANRKKADEVFKYMSKIKLDNSNLEGKLIHLTYLRERSERCFKQLSQYASWLIGISVKDYSKWDEEDKHKLEKLINNIDNSATLINERI